MGYVLVAVATAAVVGAGFVGAAAPAQAQFDTRATAASDTSTIKRGAAEVRPAAIERELYLTPPDIGDSRCKNGTLGYFISLAALPNVARSMIFKVAVPGRGTVTFDDLEVHHDAGKAWYSACVSKTRYKVIARSKRLKVTGSDYETGRKVTPRMVKVYLGDC
ncbi:hypothetical protein [Actinoplanes sp. NPDC026670]|uniref:hypothetical protein n=1 Tax=Actinoplanes sp. NPDC026670 TaxID=3154700 RepID=UPI0033D0914C